MELSLNELLTIHKGFKAAKLRQLSTGHLCIKASINGKMGKFILDTGAGGTVIDVDSSSKFKLLEEETDEKASGAGAGDIHMRLSTKNKMATGKFNVKDMSLFIMDLSHVNDALTAEGEKEIDGVIGGDFLLKGNGVIDYSELILYLKNNKTKKDE